VARLFSKVGEPTVEPIDDQPIWNCALDGKPKRNEKLVRGKILCAKRVERVGHGKKKPIMKTCWRERGAEQSSAHPTGINPHGNAGKKERNPIQGLTKTGGKKKASISSTAEVLFKSGSKNRQTAGGSWIS